MEEKYIKHIQKWIQSFVIQYNLCPFAKKPFFQEKIRYQVYEGKDIEALGLLLQ